ncbi:helix-turn-helix domain-containing protein [Priestia megaterium]
MGIEKDELSVIENALASRWGERDNLFELGTPLKDIHYLEVPLVFNKFSEQVQLYFDWFLQTKDHRTRRIVQSFVGSNWKRLDRNDPNYNKIVKGIKSGLIEAKEELIPASLKFKNLSKAQKRDPKLTNKVLELIMDGATDEDLYDGFIAKGDKQHQEFAEKYGLVKKVKAYSIETTFWQDRFWTYEWSVENGSMYVDNKFTQYLGCNPVFITKKNKRRLKERVTELHLLYTELDYYKMEQFKNTTQEEMVKMVQNKLSTVGFPHPSEITFSGGIQLIWRTNPIGQMRAPYWEFLQRYIYELLKGFGADSAVVTDSARVLRAWGSIHNDTKKKIFGKSYIKTGQRFDFDELLHTFVKDDVERHQEETAIKRKDAKQRYEKYLKYLEHKREAEIKKEEREKKKKSLTLINGGKEDREKIDDKTQAIIEDPWNIRHQRIVTDIISLVEFRNGQMNNCREYACFLVRYYTLCITGGDRKKALEKMQEIYKLLDDLSSKNYTYDWETMCRLTGSADEGYKKWASGKCDNLGRRLGYNFSKQRLREILDIKDSEDHILIALISDKEAKKRERQRDQVKKMKKRRKQGVKPKGQSKQEKINIITNYLNENPKFSVRGIQCATGISKSTVSRILKELKATEK